MAFTVKGITYRKPVACCGFCSTPVFILHSQAYPGERINECILKSKAIPPQSDPHPKQVAKCATCGKIWAAMNFTLKEGDELGTNTKCSQG